MAKKNYDVGSVHRALQHHLSTGAIRSVAVSPSRGKLWLVDVNGAPDVLDISLTEAHALVYGLMAGERTHKPAEVI